MSLSEEDKRRIEEEEYRKMARERFERTIRIEAEIETRGDHRLEVRGVGTDVYRDSKQGVKHVYSAASSVARTAFFSVVGAIGISLMAVFLVLIFVLAFKVGTEIAAERSGWEYSPGLGWAAGVGIAVVGLAGWVYVGMRMFKRDD